MNTEIIAIVMVGVALAGVILTSARGVRQEHQRIARRDRKTPRTHGAPGRADGRIARIYRRTIQGHLRAGSMSKAEQQKRSLGAR